MFDKYTPPIGNKKWIAERAEVFQKQLHDFAESVHKEKPLIEYQDIVTTFFLLKLAEIDWSVGATIRTSDL
jgi:hypothetical protein